MPGSAYSDPPTFTPLQTLTAAQQNALGDAIRSLMWWSAGGSIPYSYDADQLEELAKPSVDSILKNTSAGVPSWLALTAVPGRLHAKNTVNVTPGGQSSISSSFVDITGATFNLTLTETCTVVVLALVTGYNNTGGASFVVRSVVNGTADPLTTSQLPFNGGEVRNEALPYIYYATGVPAGTRAVKMQFASTGGTSYVERCRLFAFAFVE